MSKATQQLEALYRELRDKLDSLPETAKRTSYANHLRSIIKQTAEAAESSAELDYEKSMDRC